MSVDTTIFTSPARADTVPSDRIAALLSPIDAAVDPWNTSAQPPYVLTYQFAATGQPADLWNSFTGWTPLAEAEKAAVRAVLAEFSAVINVTFTEVTGAADPDINLGKVTLGAGEGGLGGFQYSYATTNGAVTSKTYDAFAVFSNALDLTAASNKYILLHEVGHAMTLKHPGNYDLPPPYLPAAEDNNKYTVMSYNVDPDTGNFATQLMPYDVAALQTRWGAVEVTAGIQVYGGPGNDFLLGGTGSDTLIGLGGDDIASGGAGNDGLYGGPGQDNLLGDAGNDVLIGEGGNDILQGGGDSDFLYGGPGNDQPYGGAGNDVISGDDGNDILVLEDGNDTGLGDAGNDYIYAGNGNDSLYGGGGYDVLLGEAGNDFLFAGGAQDTADYMFGGAGTDAFAVQNLPGANVIQDFNRAEGDLISLQATGLNSFAAVFSSTTSFGSFCVITIDSDTNIWVIGQTSTTLQASDFAFS